MKDYIESYISLFVKILDAIVSSPEKKGLQNVNEDLPRLGKKDSDTLHSIVVNYYG